MEKKRSPGQLERVSHKRSDDAHLERVEEDELQVYLCGYKKGQGDGNTSGAGALVRQWP